MGVHCRDSVLRSVGSYNCEKGGLTSNRDGKRAEDLCSLEQAYLMTPEACIE